MSRPDDELMRLYAARDQFADLLKASAREADFQRLFAAFPQILTSALPLKVAPANIRPLARPGRSEPDLIIFPEQDRLDGSYGIIELKRPSSRILTEPRRGIIQLSRDAQTAISQGLVYREQLRPFVQAQQALVLGADPVIFVIMGMSNELAERVAIDVYERQLTGLLPPSCQLIPYDTLLAL